jgi:hypothetical protein
MKDDAEEDSYSMSDGMHEDSSNATVMMKDDVKRNTCSPSGDEKKQKRSELGKDMGKWNKVRTEEEIYVLNINFRPATNTRWCFCHKRRQSMRHDGTKAQNNQGREENASAQDMVWRRRGWVSLQSQDLLFTPKPYQYEGVCDRIEQQEFDWLWWNNGCGNGDHHEKQVDARKSVRKGGGLTSGRRRSERDCRRREWRIDKWSVGLPHLVIGEVGEPLKLGHWDILGH